MQSWLILVPFLASNVCFNAVETSTCESQTDAQAADGKVHWKVNISTHLLHLKGAIAQLCQAKCPQESPAAA